MRCGKRVNFFSKLFLLFVIALANIGNAQNLPIGGWRMHLPYKNGKCLTTSNTSVWCATDNGLFRLTKGDNSVERITKIEGLSDLEIGTIGYNSVNDILFIGYQNGNIDLIKGTVITNLPDIKRAQIIGDKTIHNVYFVGALAYVSTGFGIVVIDTDRKEVKDTYLIGPNGTYLTILDVISDGTTIFVGTENGIYYAPINDPYLANYSTWTKFSNILTNFTNSTYDALAIYNGKLIVKYAATFPNLSFAQDLVFDYDIGTATWDSTLFNSFTGQPNVVDFWVYNNRLFICDLYSVFEYNTSFNNIANYYAINLVTPTLPPSPRKIVFDASGLWEADLANGLVKMTSQTYGESYFPNGPISTNSYWMAAENQKLLVVPGGHDDAWNNVFNTKGISTLTNGWWTNFTGSQISAIDTCYDLITAAIDPDNAHHLFVGSWGTGLLEINNGVVTNLYNDVNSTLESKPEYHWIGVSGLKYDTTGNLWVVNSHTTKGIQVRKTNGSWQAFDLTGLIPIGTTLAELTITEAGQKWIIVPRGGGIIVFDDNGTLTNTSDDKKKKLGFTAGLGNIPGTEVHCIAEDDDGEVWIGTDKGVAVFYCAENIFTTAGCDAQQILITQGNYVQILLESQTVTAIAVDGANRKWIGTESGGVFLMSADGQEEIAHFTSENSPLLSDDITCITIDKITGEVFIGTSEGIISYMGEANEGGEEMGEVYAFPNPVSHDYTGPIAITGLVKDADVKITDIRGQVVYTTTALGGRAIWDGNNFKGERAASGVYIVFISNTDGTQKAATKILFIN